MAKATIEFNDVDGLVEMTVKLDGPFDITSHAHRQANIVINYLDSVNAPAPDLSKLGDKVDHTPPKSMIHLPVPKFIQAVRGH
jgi:hypothetical protein